MQQVTVRTSRPEALFQVGGLVQAGGAVTGTMETGRWMIGADDRPSVGALGVLVDEVLGYALMASLDPGSWSISTEIWIDLLGPVPVDGNRLRGEAEPVQTGSFAAGQVLDDAGRLVAQARQRGRRIDPPQGELVEPDDAPARGDLRSRLGLRSAADGAELVSTVEVVNPGGNLHGGVSLAASELVATASRVEQGSTLPTTSVHIVHTRAVPLGSVLELTVDTRHAGRTLWVTDVTGRVGGKVCTTSRVTAQT